jgi:nucleoside phosphorylase
MVRFTSDRVCLLYCSKRHEGPKTDIATARNKASDDSRREDLYASSSEAIQLSSGAQSGLPVLFHRAYPIVSLPLWQPHRSRDKATTMKIMSAAEILAEARQHKLRLALFVTALDLEFQAVLAHLKPVASVKGRDGAIYECGTFHDVGQNWLVIVAETGAGTHPAQSIVTNAHTHFEPEIQIFVGVGGSRKEDVPKGSVVAADHVYMPYCGKYDEKGFSARPRELPAHPQILGVARKVRRDKRWVDRIKDPADGRLPRIADYPVDFPPLGHIAPVVSTEAVVANKKSDLANLIANDYGDSCIVEMEGYGAIYAASQELKPAMVVRGVSDMTDEDKQPAKDKIFQPIAACHAAAFAFELLAQWGFFHPQTNFPITAPEAVTEPATGAEGPSTATKATIARATFVLNLDAEPAEISRERLAEIEAALIEIAGEPGLKIERVEKGSLRLVVSDPSGALARLSISKLRESLESKFSIHLFGVAPEHEVQELGELAAELLRASGDLLSWPTTLPDGELIDRPELDQLLAIPNENIRSATALIGDPGSGKSALLATLGKRLVDDGYPVLAIKADLLDTEVANEADLRERLDLPDRPSTIITRLAAFRPTFLLIDQLDALAGYLDLRTGRLSTLLNLIRRLGRVDNVHIVLSARKFEYEHDVRLRAISAESLILRLPAWSKVLALLESKGIAATGWPNDAQEVLRSPQALSTYLQLDEGARSEPLGSYQAMLDRLWTERVVKGPNGPRRSQLGSSIADTMAEEESLWLARARFEHVNDDIEALIGAGILTPNTSGASIGFAHQTVFDYALARGFSQERGRLSNYVLGRQASIFLRPKVWTALTYLRSADMMSYQEELAVIWGTQGLRRHLRLLLIDFLGQQGAPTDHEAVLMEQALKIADERAVAFRAMAGSDGWFSRFAKSYFADAMSEGGLAADWMIAILIAAWPSNADAVERLITEQWLPDAVNDARTWRVIEQSPVWSEGLIKLATTVLHRTSIAPIYLEHIVSTVGVEQPEIALKLVRAGLERELATAVRAAAELAARPEPSNLSDEDKMVWFIGNDPRRSLKSLIESSNNWDTLPALAEQAPAAFIALLWPWYVEAFEALRKFGHEREGQLGYALEYEADFRFEGEHSLGLPEPSLLAAARTATEKLASEQPAEFRAWVAANAAIDVAPVQRLIAHSFTVNPGELAGDALTFLSGDRRRLWLGGIESHTGTTTRLIAAVSGHWSETQILNFERMVWNFNPPIPADIDDPRRRLVWRRMLRRLKVDVLRALPARRTSNQTRRRLREEERALPGGPIGATFSGGFIGSIMSAADIGQASDEDVINAFRTLPDSTMWNHPGDWEKGGNIQLAREFANFAKAEPERAFRLIERFEPSFGERAAGYSLAAMAATANPAVLMSTIISLAGRGFEGDEFRRSAAMGIEELLNRKIDIDESIVELYKRWLFERPPQVQNQDDTTPSAEPSKDAETNETADEDPVVRSLLWGYGGVSVVPGGKFPLLEVIVRIYLRRNDIPKLLDFLTAALKQHVGDQICWQHLLTLLIYLRPAAGEDGSDRVNTLQQIIDRFPSLLGTRELAYLFGHVHWWATDFAERELTRWQTARARTARLGYGELVALLALLHPDREWPKQALAAIEQGAVGRDARAGAAMSAVNLWSNASHRTRATALIVRLLLDAGEGEWSAVFDLFRIVEELTPEVNTVLLLEAIADNMDTAPRLNSSFVVDRLETLLPHEAPLVARIAEGLVRKWREELGNLHTGTATIAPKLVDIAVTLHRLGPNTREEGTRLFEQLLDIDAYLARATLDEIDSRFRQERAMRRPRLPRRSQRQRKRNL